MLTAVVLTAGSAKLAAAGELRPPIETEPEAAVREATPVAHKPTHSHDQGARLAGDRKRTLFMADLTKSVKVHIFTLADPYRVIIELPHGSLKLPEGEGSAGVGVVKSYQFGTFGPAKSRIVLDVGEPVLVDKIVVSEAKGREPARLHIELVPTDRTLFMAGQSRLAMTEVGAMTPSKLGSLVNGDRSARAPAPARKPVIVLDPGHGGHDTGATKNGAIEKNVVLAFALALRDKLLASGLYEVQMTRSDDTFVELSERRDFARRKGAALFIAIHADYVPTSTSHGATVYSLRGQSNGALAKAWSNKDSSDKGAKGDWGGGAGEVEENPAVLKSILDDLSKRYDGRTTKTQTEMFTHEVIDHMAKTTTFKEEPHREAGFAVLRSSDVPSVLIELAYVSNPQDAANLKSDLWRDKVSTSIMNAVHRYMNTAKLPL